MFRSHSVVALYGLRLALLPIFLAFLTVTLSVAQGSSLAGKSSPTVLQTHQQGFIVPFVPVPGQGSPLVTVWLNKSQTATFVVDTGTNNCLISQSLAAKLGLLPVPAKLPDGKPLLFDGKQPQEVTLTSLKLGGKSGPLNIEPLHGAFLVLPDQQLRVSANCLVDGLIGSSLLEEFAVALDFSGCTMIICYPGSLTLAEAQYLGYHQEEETIMPIFSANNFYYAQVDLKNNTVSLQVNLLLDTGSDLTAIPRDAAQKLSLVSLRQLPQAGLSANFTVNEARLQRLSLGNLDVKNQLVTYGIEADHSPRLGLDILSHYKVLLDFPAKKMYLQPVQPLVPVAPAGKLQNGTPQVKKP